jgi:hypothetical protein
MANAGKLSVAQLQQAVKNGTVPAYIGIPLMQEKIKQAKQAQPVQAPTEPPIAQQVMAEASGIDQMPSNLPTQSMNDGGIVSFADGGDVDDQEEYEDQRDEAEYAQAIEDSLNAAEQGGRSAAPNTAPVASSANINSTPSVEGGIRSVVNEAANKYGLPPELLQRISGSESGHNPRAKNSASSAEGLFQFIPSTWAGMGGKPGEQSDPVKNADLGGKFIRQNAETLKRQLGRNPNYDEVYAAHYFGPGVTAMLKNATPDMPIEQGLRMFNSEKFVPIIMQQNPNLRGKTVGQVMGSLREKMGEGQVSLAEGGIARLNNGGIPRYQSAGFVSDEDAEENLRVNNIIKNIPDPAALYQEKSPDKERYSFDNPLSSRMIYKSNPKVTEEERLKYIKHALNFGPEGAAGTSNERSDRLLPPGVTLPNVPAATSIPSASQSPPMQAPFDYEYGKGATVPIETKTGAGVDTIKDTSSSDSSSSGSSGARQKSEYDLIREDIMSQREELKRQKQEDKYMAILQAGLGMMAGTSPNAFANIGQGASAGIAQYSQSGKQRAAENAALNKGLITAQRYKGMDDYQRAALASRVSYQDRMLGDKGEAAAERLGLKQEELERLREKDIGTLINNGSARATAELKAKFPNPDLLSDKDKIAYKQEEANLYAKYVAPFITVQNQMLQKRYPEYFKDDASVRPAPTGGNIIRYDAKGNVIK